MSILTHSTTPTLAPKGRRPKPSMLHRPSARPKVGRPASPPKPDAETIRGMIRRWLAAWEAEKSYGGDDDEGMNLRSGETSDAEHAVREALGSRAVRLDDKVYFITRPVMHIDEHNYMYIAWLPVDGFLDDIPGR